MTGVARWPFGGWVVGGKVANFTKIVRFRYFRSLGFLGFWSDLIGFVECCRSRRVTEAAALGKCTLNQATRVSWATNKEVFRNSKIVTLW